MRLLAGIMLLALVAIAAWVTMRDRGAVQAEETTIAILPFANLGVEDDNYLRIALADELTTLLSRSHDLAVRPFSQSRHFDVAADLSLAARELYAELLLTGHYRAVNDDLEITLELANPHAGTVVWRGKLDVPRADTLSLNKALAGWVNVTLLPALGLEPEPGPSSPANAEAYELYLRSLALSEDPGPEHARAKSMLEQSLALDAGYAPAWDAFARRLYLDSQGAGEGGELAFRRAEAAQQRALDIDPDLIEAATGLTNMRTERGDLNVAYRAARKKADELPRHALTRFSLSYVLRFMGYLDEALRECEIAYGLDPQVRLRSCALPYAVTGNYHRAYDFLDLDAGKDWVESWRAEILLREGKVDEARAIWSELPDDFPGVAFWLACLAGDGAAELEVQSMREETKSLAGFDPESKYFDGALQAWCGRTDAALRLLEAAVDQNYCSWPAVDFDPLWEPVRGTPEFARIREKAIACHERFEPW